MKTKKLIKDALEIPIIVVTSLWRKSDAMHMHAATFILVCLRLVSWRLSSRRRRRRLVEMRSKQLCGGENMVHKTAHNPLISKHKIRITEQVKCTE
jgi:hypothetical protein